MYKIAKSLREYTEKSNGEKIVIDHIKNINHMEFLIPAPGLHIITGKNGSGKTTLFTCLSRIKNSNAYRVGFPTSNGNDNLDVFSGYIQYEVDGESVRYSKRTNGKWIANRQNSSVFDLMGYPQVVNITTKDERVFTQVEITPRRNNKGDEWINEKLNHVFGTDKYSKMIRITTGQLYRGRGKAAADTKRRNIAYAIPIDDRRYYTERNFSFGEIVLLNLLYDIHNVQNGSLVLIDELELALHPSAQIRLFATLQELASEKGLTILVSTHSASLIRSRKSVILLEASSDNNINVMYDCPPAKAIGAIGMKEDTMPDIIILVEDNMAKALFMELKRRYFVYFPEQAYLDIRVLEIGGYKNVINFYVEASNYVFYDNVYVAAYMDKDVETDIIPYPQFGNEDAIQAYQDNSRYLKFLPYTPEVLLVKTYLKQKNNLVESMRMEYSNQQLDYGIPEQLDFDEYESELPEFADVNQYNRKMEERGAFRKKCKKNAELIVNEISEQLNISVEEIYRYTYKFAVDNISETEINVRGLLAPTMKRVRYNKNP